MGEQKFSLLGIEMPFEEFDYLMCEQAKGKELKVVGGKVIAEYHVLTEEEKLNDLRQQREIECFPIINRGQLWYDTLTEQQKIELGIWYKAWLNVTDTLEVPIKPERLK